MYAPQIYTLFVALLATVAAADPVHDRHWSRRAHKAVAVARSPSAAAPVVRSTKKTTRPLGRRSCSAKNSTSVASSGAVQAVSVSSTKASAASTKAASTKAATTTPSSKTTSISSASTSTSSTGGVLSLGALFPESTPGKSWTTSPKSSSALPLSDSTFQPTNLIKALSHTYMSAPDGKEAMRATYPEGSYTFTHDPQGGISFYAPGPDSLDMTTAKTLTLGYSVYFEEGFDFNKGGKLPGLYGGDSPDGAIGCSGGRRSVECYSVRLMWRTGGMGEIYSYLPDYEVDGFSANKKVCDVAPLSECNPTYGASVGRGSFTFPTGAWTTVSQRVKLNDVGQANGEMQLWVNGKSVINVSGIILRDSAAGRHRGIQMQTFFGGSGADWASPKTQSSYFSDFSVAIIETL
ncbi:hypothetical protein B0H10DRAFT_2163832 [Mycena sp. CBHHK59/15]|nr:hypothetical protein B0H10DRAFT_2163832 [Mycena sp. CBHHK59/15]